MNQEKFTMMILNEMPTDKKEKLHAALLRNNALTSCKILENGTIDVYKEGWYIQLFGCRSSFTVWANDNDGEFTFSRKPIEKKLHKIYRANLKFTDGDYDNF